VREEKMLVISHSEKLIEFWKKYYLRWYPNLENLTETSYDIGAKHLKDKR